MDWRVTDVTWAGATTVCFAERDLAQFYFDATIAAERTLFACIVDGREVVNTFVRDGLSKAGGG